MMASSTSYDRGKCKRNEAGEVCNCQEWDPSEADEWLCECCTHHMSFHEPRHVNVECGKCLTKGSSYEDGCREFFPGALNPKFCAGCACHRGWHKKRKLDEVNSTNNDEEAIGVGSGVHMECESGVPQGCGTTSVDTGLQRGRGVEESNARMRDHLEPKHKVFLSHSGFQKSFVEQLCVDLEGRDRYPFFDKCWDSLPVGKKFPELLFSAIRQCEVGVVVLSEEFFTHSKWPMLELVEMVRVSEELNRGMDIVPVYYNIAREKCRNQETQRGWKKKWEEWAEKDSSINVDKWFEALKIFGSTTGLVLRSPREEVQLRFEVVEAICKLVLPESRPDDSDVEGKDRLCKIILDKIGLHPQDSSIGVRIVGLYGVGGIGKTTICKVLYNKLFKEFHGKVCHIELKSKSKLELFRDLLRTITNTRHDLLDKMDVDKCQDQLKRCIVKQPIFLAIDNVDEDSSSDAKTFLEALHSFANGSVVVVTSRSLDQLKALNIREDDCLGMPELVHLEARNLFKRFVASIVEAEIKLDERMIDKCVEVCCFERGDGSNRHYHPLALKVLGNVLREEIGCHGFDSTQWDAKISKLQESYELLEAKKRIFSILRISYDTLSLGDQMLFVDVALIVRHKLSDEVSFFDFLFRTGEYGYEFECLDTRMGPNLFEWLGTVHGQKNLDVIKARLEKLKKKSLLESVGDGSTHVGIHDLWREFCIAEIEVEDFADRRCVYYAQECKGLGESSPAGRCWEKLERMCFTSKAGTQKFLGLQIDHFANLKVLIVVVCMEVMNPVEVDLGKLRHLKHLELGNSHKTFVVRGLGSLSNLAYLKWFGMPDDEVYAEDIGLLTNLQFLKLPCSRGQRLPDMSLLTSLQVAFFERCQQVEAISSLSSKLTNIRSLNLSWCSKLRSCPVLDDLVSLETLDLSYCAALEELPNLERLTNLKELMMRDCSSLSICRGLSGLRLLQKMDISRCTKLRTLPCLGDLVSLIDLNLEGCRSLAWLSSTETLQSLKRLNLSYCGSICMLDLSPFPQLEEVKLCYCPSLTSLRCGVPLHALKKLDSEGCEQLKELPDLCSFVNLEVLCLPECSSLACLTCTETLQCLKRLPLSSCKSMHVLDMSPFPQLEAVELDGCLSLTSLRCGVALTALKKLEIHECVQLKELPDLCNFVNLQELCLSGCASLTCLTCSETLKSLKRLDLYGCEIMDMLDLSPFPKLEAVELDDCLSLTMLGCSVRLPDLWTLKLDGCVQLEELSDLCNFVNLKELCLPGCSSLACLTCTETLESLKRLDLYGCEIMDMLDLSSFPKLEALDLDGCLSLTKLVCGVRLPDLWALKIDECVQLKELPDLCNFVNLKELCLTGCSSLACLTCTETLQSLKVLEVDRREIMDLLDFSSFPQLESALLGGYVYLKSMGWDVPFFQLLDV